MVLMDNGATVVVTGANGFIGRACVAQLMASGWRVRGLVRELDATTAARSEFMGVGDLVKIDDRALRNALRGATAIVHLAARVHQPPGGAGESQAAMRVVNVEVTRRLARSAADAGIGHFVFASTVKVNGEMTLPGRPFRESDPPDPHDDYAASKWAAEQALAAVADESGLRVTALRLPLTYGPDAKANFAALARVVRRGIPLPFASVENRRSVLSVGNFSAAVATLLASGDVADGGRMMPYLVADAEPVSTPDLIRAIAQAMGVTPRLFGVPEGLLRSAAACVGREGAVGRLLGSLEVDTTAFRTRFGWVPPVTLARGLAAAFGPAAPL
jgi:nucleoside-diphosphate-sugar epimerase